MSPTVHVSRRLFAWLVVLGGIVVTALIFALPVATTATGSSGSGLGADVQSVQAEQLQAKLPSADVQPAVVVAGSADGAPLTQADVAALTTLSRSVAGYAVGGQVPPPQVSENGEVATFVVPMSTTAGEEQVAKNVEALRADLSEGAPDGVTVQVTGSPAFTADLTKVFEGADVTLLIVTASVVAFLLLITYRSPFLWIFPLVVVGVTEQATLHLVEVLLPRWGLPADGSVTGITSVLVFGAATNYALLLISRYREQLRLRENRFDAMAIALRRSGEAILASGSTVILSVLTLLLASIESTRALGAATAIGVAMALGASLLVLPAVLAIAGRWIFWPFVPKVGTVGREGRVWGRVGTVAARRPAIVAAGGMALLGVLALGGIGLQTGLSATEQFRVKPEAVLALEKLSTAFPAGASTPVAVMTTPAAAQQVADAAAAVDGVASAAVGEKGDGVAQVNVVLEAEPGTPESNTAIRDLRAAVGEVAGSGAGGLPGAVVGGTVATQLDLADAQAHDRKVIIPLVLLLVFTVLVALLRALVAPVLLMVTVVASFFASVGASWFLFTHVLDFPALDDGVLLLAFLFLVALGVDYNIFLVTRAKEEAASAGTKAGMLTALKVTGGVITSAGILLAAVFAVLGVLPLITLTQIGIIVCLGVLLDTLLVRTLIVPALAIAVGDRFWWPGRMSRGLRGDGALAETDRPEPQKEPVAV